MHKRTPCTNQIWQAQSNSEKVCIPPLWQSISQGHTGAFPGKRCYAAVQVALYCDLHGHSRKHGTFMYGCEQAPSPQVSHTSCLPHCMHFSAPPIVSYRSESHTHHVLCRHVYALQGRWSLLVVKAPHVRSNVHINICIYAGQQQQQQQQQWDYLWGRAEQRARQRPSRTPSVSFHASATLS